MISDFHIRQQALDPAQSFIMQAPAGSGKTEILTQRYLMLLAHAQHAPEEVVAITFTRKAAAEMRTRIIHALQLAQQPAPDKNNYRYHTWVLANNVLKRDEKMQWNLIENPNRLRIMTMDALSTFLCRHSPLLSGLGGESSVCENPQEIYEMAAKKTIAEIFIKPEYVDASQNLLLHLDNQAEKLIELFSDLLGKRDQWLPHVVQKKADAQLRAYLESAWQTLILEKITAAFNSVPLELKQSLQTVARYAVPACNTFTFSEKPTLDHVEAWIGLAYLLLTDKLEWRKKVDKNTGFPTASEEKSLMMELLSSLSAHTTFQKNLALVRQLPPKQFTDKQWNALHAITTLLPFLAAQLHLVFREKNEMDFLELSLRALNALGSSESPTDLTLYLDYKIQHLLIDEFQDTSIVHFQLIEKLISGWEPNDGRSLFLVGDPMQSIYRFRNAEVGLFLRAQQYGIGHITLTPLTLTMNFRSDAALVNWFNYTFSTIFPAQSDIATGSVPYAASHSAAITETTPSLHYYFEHTHQDEVDKIIAGIKQIQSHASSDTIAILLRTRTHAADIIAALRTHYIAFQCVDIEPLLHEPVIQDLMTLTRALLHRADNLSWLALLRAPWCGINLFDLEIISLHANNKIIYDALFEEDQLSISDEAKKRILFLRERLQHAFQQQSYLTLDQWVRSTWISLLGPATVLAENELHYAESFFNLLRECTQSQDVITIEKIETACQKLYSNPKPDMHIKLQIMTIHKSKGLEFDHVFLPLLQQKSANDQSQLFRWLEKQNQENNSDLLLAPIQFSQKENDPMYDFLRLLETEKKQQEEIRLLYVATTRAKKSLHLSGTVEYDVANSAWKKSGTGAFLEKLWDMVEPHIQLSADCAITENVQQPTQNLTRITAALMDHQIFSAIAQHASAFISLDIADDTSSIVGTVIHEILQHMTARTLSAYKAGVFPVLQWKSRLLSLHLNPTQIDFALQKIQRAAHNIAEDSIAQWILSEHRDAKNEWSLTTKENNEIKTHKIDRTFIENNVRWIIDYKTAEPFDGESMDAFLARQSGLHAEQLQRYAQLFLHESHEIKLGIYFPLCSGWLTMIPSACIALVTG